MQHAAPKSASQRGCVATDCPLQMLHRVVVSGDTQHSAQQHVQLALAAAALQLLLHTQHAAGEQRQCCSTQGIHSCAVGEVCLRHQ